MGSINVSITVLMSVYLGCADISSCTLFIVLWVPTFRPVEREGRATAVKELQHVDARVAPCMNCHNHSVCVTFLTHVQKLTYKDRVRVRCVLNAKHTHRHRTPPPWDKVSFRTSEAWDERIIQSDLASFARVDAVVYSGRLVAADAARRTADPASWLGQRPVQCEQLVAVHHRVEQGSRHARQDLAAAGLRRRQQRRMIVHPKRDNSIEQGLTSHQTHLGHIGDGFHGSNDPTNSVKALKKDRS